MSAELLIQYIEEQPEVIRRVIEGIRVQEIGALEGRFRPDAKPDVYMLGSGSSLNAAHAVKSFWLPMARSLEILDPANFILYLDKGFVSKDSVVIGISQSGQSAVTVDAIHGARKRGIFTLSVSGAENGPLSKAAHEKVLVQCGEELVGPKTKGYSACVASLIGLALALQAKRQSQESVETISEYLKHQTLIEKLVIKHEDTNLCFVIGSGDNYGTAKEAALKIMEIAKIPSMHFELEDSMHGPFTTVTDKTFVVVLGADHQMKDRMVGLLRILESIGAKGMFVANGAVHDLQDEALSLDNMECDPIADIVPAQVLAYWFAVKTGKHPTQLTYDRDFVRSITKVTN